MKTVKLSSVKSEKAFDFIMNEVDLLKTLDHPNIVRLQEVYMSDSHLFMAMDLITGGNLAGSYRCDGEHTAAIIIRQIVRALRYLHDRHIAHRDLKLENVLIETGDKEGSPPAIKLIDFGLSAIYRENGVSTDILGSWNYVAPEVIKGQYHPAPADMWSLGVVTHFLMSRMLPFNADTSEGIQRNILWSAWARASEASKHFVRSLLLKSADLRLTAAGAQKHDWLREAEDLSQTPRKDSTFREEVTQSLLSFRDANPMKQLALEVVARTLDPTQIRQLADEFDRADNNNNGEVSLAEFKRWLEANGAARGMADEDVEASFNSVDVDHSGSIHFNEFLAAAIQQRHMDKQSLRPAFDRLDRSHTGFINLDDVTLTTGAAANEEESKVLVGHFDMNGDGQISFEEFVNGMRRMGGSSRDGGGLLSIPPAAAPPASPSGSPRGDATTVPEREPGEEEEVGNAAPAKEEIPNCTEGTGHDGEGKENSKVLTLAETRRPEPHQPEAPRDRFNDERAGSAAAGGVDGSMFVVDASGDVHGPPVELDGDDAVTRDDVSAGAVSAATAAAAAYGNVQAPVDREAASEEALALAPKVITDGSMRASQDDQQRMGADGPPEEGGGVAISRDPRGDNKDIAAPPVVGATAAPKQAEAHMAKDVGESRNQEVRVVEENEAGQSRGQGRAHHRPDEAGKAPLQEGRGCGCVVA
ncbi:unnamed protein product [Ectocarpus sp. CCAP 1310/34]|nr:unnamed protein product [Ectocarpus sp. CCAP 1310/34]